MHQEGACYQGGVSRIPMLKEPSEPYAHVYLAKKMKYMGAK